MSKTIRKLDAAVVKALTVACEKSKDEVTGFEWLTHTANYSNFPGSLMVICIFTDEDCLQQAKSVGYDVKITSFIHNALLRAGIVLKQPKKHIIFDSEQACEREHQGNWKKRLAVKH